MFSLGLPDQSWDDQLESLAGHFLQSRAWAQLQLSLGREVAHDQGHDWSWLGERRHGRGGINYLKLSYGPTFSGELEPALISIRQAGKETKADFARLEPVGRGSDAELKAAGLVSFPEIEPTTTLIIDLTSDEETLRGALASGTRRAINAAERKGIGFTTSSDIEPFLRMIHDTYQRAGIGAYSDEYYRRLLSELSPLGAAELFYATHQGAEISAILAFKFRRSWYYAHVAADQAKNRELQTAAPLAWHVILAAKTAGAAIFDFWGIAPTDDQKHPWAGVTKFKQSFGGQVLHRLGTWDLPLKTTKYKLYRAAKTVLPL